MYEFEYHQPKTLDEAAKIFADADDPSYIAGGQTLLPVMKQRLAMPSDLIDLGAIEELKGISLDGDTLTIGAMTTHAEVAASEAVKKAIPALVEMAVEIGDPPVRNRGTIGGSISNSDPAADYPGALVGLGATVHTTKRDIPADEFFTGLFETALEDGELVVKVSFPVPEKAAYAKFHQPASRFALVGVFCAKTKQGTRVAVTGAGSCVFRVKAFEAALDASFSADALDGLTISSDDLNSDLHASAEYRAHLVCVMAKRAVANAI